MVSKKATMPTTTTALGKDKLQPFGAQFLTRLDGANDKLMCSLSASPQCDVVTDHTAGTN
jgi:hypothetical protein